MKKNISYCLFAALLIICVLLASCAREGGEITTDPITESVPITEAPETTTEVTEEITEAETTEAETETEIPETTVIPEIYEAYVYFYAADGEVVKVTVKPDTTLPSSVFESIEIPEGGNGVKIKHKGWEYSLTKDGERKAYDFAEPPAVTLEGLHIYPVLEYSYLVFFGSGEGYFPEGVDTEFFVKAGEPIDPEVLLTRNPSKPEDSEYSYEFIGFSLNGTDTVNFPIVAAEPMSFTAIFDKTRVEYTMIIHTEYGELIGGGKTNYVSGTQAEVEAVLDAYYSYKPADVYVGNSRYVFKEFEHTREGREWTLELVWERQILNYTVSLDCADGGAPELVSVADGGKIVLPIIEQREDKERHYTFVGWRDENGYLYNGGYELTVSGNASFKAEFAPGARKVYTVVFETPVGRFENGACEMLITGYYGDPLIPPVISAESLIFGEVVYSFAGWDKEVPATFEENEIFSAIFTTPEKVYFLDFYVDDELILRVRHYAGAKLEAPERPDFTLDRIFSGWSEIPEFMPEEDVRIYATTRLARIVYMLDGEELLTDYSTVGRLVTLAAPAQKQGYTVSGWTTSDISLVEGNSFIMPEHDVVFSAVSTPNHHTVTYIIDGVVLYTDSVHYGDIYTVRGIEVKMGFDFTGWTSQSGAFDGEGSVIVIPDRDVVFLASFTPCLYSVNYYLDGSLIYSDYYFYGDTVTLRPDEYQEGCSFTWNSAAVNLSGGSFMMPACGVDIYGAFSDGDNKIIFIVDGAPYGSIGVTAGQRVDLRLMPTKQGYSFTGWSCDEVDVSEGEFIMPEGDIVLRGSFIPNAYDVIFLDTVSGKVIGTSYLDYGASFSLGDRIYCIEGKVSSGWVLIYGDVLRKGDHYIMPDSEVVFGIVWETCLTVMTDDGEWAPYFLLLEEDFAGYRYDEATKTLYLTSPASVFAGESEGVTVVLEYVNE